jgi:PKD repeat protein
MKLRTLLASGSAAAVVALCFFYFNTTTKNELNKDTNPQPIPTKNEHPLSISDDFNGKTSEKSKTVEQPTSTDALAQVIVEDDVMFIDGKPTSLKKLPKSERINEAVELERLRTLDPALGYVPLDRRVIAWEQTKRMQAQLVQKEAAETGLRGSIQKNRWVERGPGNVGGRTRAMLLDLNDPTKGTMFAAGATGGLFKVTNITSKDARWTRINDWLQVLAISSIAQDPRNPKIMYIGTGDVAANNVEGNGIFKSVDGGTTWKYLSFTGNGDFKMVSGLIVIPENGHVLASTFAGIHKSKDGGETWEKVLGSGLAFGNGDNKMYDLELASNGTMYACSQGRVYKASKESGGEVKTWTNISSAGTNFPTSWSRCEIAVAPSNPNVVYAVGAVTVNGARAGSPIFVTTNGGETWTQKNKPIWKDQCGGAPSDADFTRGQAWYDLSLVVAPNDPTTVYVGGVDFFRSTNSGQSWTQLTMWSGNCGTIKYAHADQHNAIFEPNNPNVLYMATDGGVFRIDNPATDNFVVTEKTVGFITTMFYGCAIHPGEGVNHFLAGAQDNGTLLIRNAPGVGTVNGRSIGGDGFLCFIDQNEPNIQIGSLYYGNFFLSTNGGENFGSGATSSGGFLTPADYDDKNNILYAQTSRGELWRWKVAQNAGEVIDLGPVTLTGVTNVYVDLNVDNRVYVGTNAGKVYRMDNANTGTVIPDVTLTGSFIGSISSVSVETGNKDHILVTISNYGVKSVYETVNGGTGWSLVEGNLPDMPVRWGMFNPNDPKQALLATDFGVWSTDLLSGDKTVWNPPFPGSGTPLVRTDMLQMRASDKTVLAATFGRGIWTSNSFGTPKSVIDYNGVSYVTANTQFKGESSNGADSYLWEFGDGGKDSLENSSHVYDKIGTYDVSLTVNGDSKYKTTTKIKILPRLNTPYKKSSTGYLGGFEGSDEHFGAFSLAGSKFEKGKSVIVGKGGTNSGNNAYVLDIAAQTYQKNTTAYLYLPMYDMTTRGIYQFSFWSVFDIQRGYDGMQVEYSLDKGITWQVLGKDNADWYDYKNTTVSGGAFPIGTSYFSGALDDWKRFKVNISNLSGNPNVAFRFVFKSDGDNVAGAGVAIDDVEVSRYEGELKTAITTQTGSFTKTQTSVDVNFKTQPEYFAKTFELEMSENGKTFKKVATFTAKGESTEELIDYTYRLDGTPFDIYFFRVKSINEDAPSNYKYSFYSTPFVVKRFKDVPLSVSRVYPSPFTNFIGVLFNDVVDNKDVQFDVYDVSGRLVSTDKRKFTGVYHEIGTSYLAKGVYLVSVKIGEEKPLTFKVFGGN